jgi:SsrA-binding protein
MSEKHEGRNIAQNRKAWHDYFIEETYEAGIALVGTEVKSVRAGNINLKDSYAEIKDGEIFLYNMHVSPYEKGNIFNKDPLRTRKLLMHRREIARLTGYIRQKGYTLVPLKVYLVRNRIKIELGVARGKKLYDKRESIMKRDAERNVERAFKDGHREK